jgi:allantoin racemase
LSTMGIARRAGRPSGAGVDMKIFVINPNTSVKMTEHIRRELDKIKRAETEVTVRSPQHGPESIDSVCDEVLAGPGTLELVAKANSEGYDAVLLACFSDPALDAAKEISRIPVVGIEEATLHVAAMLGHKFSILTPLSRRVPIREVHVRLRGLEASYASSHSLDMAALETETQPEKARLRALELARKAIEEHEAEVIILGCAGLAGYAQDIERDLDVPVLDPVAVAFKVAEAMAELGLRHSKVRRFAGPGSRGIP